MYCNYTIRWRITLCTFLLLATLPTSRADEAPKSAATFSPINIQPDRYFSHINFLANDALEGRGTGSNGIDIAAGYIAAHFQLAGLEPAGDNGSYFQRFTIPSDPELKDDSSLAIEASAKIEPKLRTDFIPFGFSGAGEFSAEAVFIGYGIVNPEKNHDDYAGADVTGKVVLMLRREPKSWSDGPNGTTEHARFETKLARAKEKGVAAVIIANQEPDQDEVETLMPFGRSSPPQEIPAIHVKREVMDQILSAGGLRTFTELQKQLDESGKNVSSPLKGVKISGKVSYEISEMVARNVIGKLPGNGMHKHEHVFIGGHYDHLGIRRGQIYNGADDNASGTSGVIELAYELAKQPARERSLVFMAFSAEEIGLDGSEYFVKHPTFPISTIVAMLNMDMIGRLTPDVEANMLAIQGLGTGSFFKEIVERETGADGLKFIPDESARGPSDHSSFYNAGVPSLFFFTGVHDDYHMPGDDIEKVNVEGGVRVAALVGRIAMSIVNHVEAPQYAKVDQRANISRGASPDSNVVIGVMPDNDDDSKDGGWRIAQVLPNGSAAKAGMKAGDRIINIDGHAVNSMNDYREATKEKKPGDFIEVKVKRDKEELTLKVELAARGRR